MTVPPTADTDLLRMGADPLHAFVAALWSGPAVTHAKRGSSPIIWSARISRATIRTGSA